MMNNNDKYVKCVKLIFSLIVVKDAATWHRDEMRRNERSRSHTYTRIRVWRDVKSVTLQRLRLLEGTITYGKGDPSPPRDRYRATYAKSWRVWRGQPSQVGIWKDLLSIRCCIKKEREREKEYRDTYFTYMTIWLARSMTFASSFGSTLSSGVWVSRRNLLLLWSWWSSLPRGT